MAYMGNVFDGVFDGAIVCFYWYFIVPDRTYGQSDKVTVHVLALFFGLLVCTRAITWTFNLRNVCQLLVTSYHDVQDSLHIWHLEVNTSWINFYDGIEKIKPSTNPASKKRSLNVNWFIRSK